jgi:hypothetical protein
VAKKVWRLYQLTPEGKDISAWLDSPQGNPFNEGGPNAEPEEVELSEAQIDEIMWKDLGLL